MPRRSTVRAVTTIGNDMGKNTLHMVGLDSFTEGGFLCDVSPMVMMTPSIVMTAGGSAGPSRLLKNRRSRMKSLSRLSISTMGERQARLRRIGAP